MRQALYVVGLAWRRARRRSSGALLAAGAGDQRMYVSRQYKVVIVRQATGILAALGGRRDGYSDREFLAHGQPVVQPFRVALAVDVPVNGSTVSRAWRARPAIWRRGPARDHRPRRAGGGDRGPPHVHRSEGDGHGLGPALFTGGTALAHWTVTSAGHAIAGQWAVRAAVVSGPPGRWSG